jgi:hypothetical protein
VQLDQSDREQDEVKLPDRGIQVGDMVRFLNPDGLKSARIYEGVPMEVSKILAGSVAFCLLPDGGEKSFGVDTLALELPNPTGE